MEPTQSYEEKLQLAKERIQKYRKLNSFIHPSVTIPEHVIIGKNVIIHENCTLGTEGFFCVADESGTLMTIPHLGKLIIEDNVEIQPGTDISRGFSGDTIIGKGTKIAAHCHIAHDVKIGENCILCAKSILCGYVVLGNQVWIGPNSSIIDSCKVGDRALIGIATNIIRNVEPDHVVVGNPGRVIRKEKTPHLSPLFGDKSVA